MLTITKLNAGYNGFHVLKDVSMDIKQGEIVAVIGPNGAGKSTVIKAIYSIADTYSGKILLEGKDITKLKTHQLMQQGVSFVTQGRVNFGSLTVEENLRIGADLNHNETYVQKRLKYVYKMFPVLKERRKSRAYGLSGGQQQMLALGRALMQDPKILMLDEPSLGLSPLLQKEVFKTIQKLNKEGLTIIIVEQNAKKAIEIADKTYLLESGKVALTGGKDIVENPKIKKIYLGG